MSEALPKSLHLFGVSVAYRSPSTTAKSTWMSEPPSVSVALPDAAVAGATVRSPVSTLIGNPVIFPVTDNTRWPLLTFLVVSADCLSKVLASGSGAPLCLEPDEHPATKAARRLREASTANRRWRVCIPSIVEGAHDPLGKRGVRWPAARRINLVQCSPDLSRNWAR